MKIGDKIRITIYGRLEYVTVLSIHRFGTIDVERRDGRCFRLSGLNH